MDKTKGLRSQARYQVERSAIESFVEMLSVYKELEPEIRASADAMIEILAAPATTQSEWDLSLHTLMEVLLGDDSAEW
jgi:hypothetical protein